ncbi:Major facilitator superfamily domain general substrate transporter [Penicillium malachiteum]|uniref:Major facilitator superfamily domain general substrate transporter n=1 Tax=Penicillium malachiteum TaxID=1324776 RepID=UPI002548CC3B|nr:Major facilitator superfamily domain general substrate transporter [Penicillium malachiteum]KAJ5713640.1 Major facilitator superfamily domain general substrate transporter [Penicillium malachiteum]
MILIPFTLIPLFFVPETLPSLKEEPSKPNTGPEEPQPRNITSYLKQSLHLFKESLASLQSRSISIIIATCLILKPEFIGTSQFFGQYVSKRFNWTLAETGYLRTLRGVTQMLVLLVILPALSKFLLRWQTPAARDLTLARGSVIIATIGVLWMAAPKIEITITGLGIQSLGGGLGPLCRSLANSFVSPGEVSKLNTLMGIVETSGSLFAGPALAWLFEIGLKKGGLFIGLPYFGLAAAFLLCVLGLFFVRALAEEDHDGDDDCLSIECVDDVRR